MALGDSTTIPTFEQDPQPYIRPVEIMAGPVFERFSIAEALHQQFAEAEAQQYYIEQIQQPEYWAKEYPRDVDAYRMYMQKVLTNLNESSAVHELRQAVKNGEEVTDFMCDAVERSLKRAEERALHQLSDVLSEAQIKKLHTVSTSQINYSVRDLLAERLAASEEIPLRRQKKVISFLADPKMRNVRYMSSGEILHSLRNTLSTSNQDQLKREVDTIRRFESVPDVHEAMDTEEFSTIAKAA